LRDVVEITALIPRDYDDQPGEGGSICAYFCRDHAPEVA
jgi:hypothetical protein